MFVDVEEILGRELREVADGLHDPGHAACRRSRPVPDGAGSRCWSLPPQSCWSSPGRSPWWRPPETIRGWSRRRSRPARPSRPSRPTRSRRPRRRSPTCSTSGCTSRARRSPAPGGTVQGSDAGWLALRTDNTWWWGRGPEPHEIPGYHDKPPVISPNGRYVAEIRVENGAGVLTGFDTQTGGAGWGSVPVELGDPEDGTRCTSGPSRTTAR